MPGKGSCSCGSVQYEFTSDILNIVNCHCQLCRSTNGTAFTSYAIVRSESFSVNGVEFIRQYSVNDSAVKHFCTQCGCTIYSQVVNAPKIVMIILGFLQGADKLKPKCNTYTNYKLHWIDHVHELPSYEEAYTTDK